MLRSRTILGLAAIVALAGCAKSKTRSICERQGELYCSFYFGCCSQLERSQILIISQGQAWTPVTLGYGLGPVIGDVRQPELDEGACLEAVAASCATNLYYLEAAEAEGRIALDEAVAEECLEPLQAGLEACDANMFNFSMAAPEACGHIVSGTVVVGGSCYGSVECLDTGAACEMWPIERTREPDSPQVSRLEGVCVLPILEGEPCQNPGCAAGLYCDYRRDPPICSGLLSRGQDCDGSVPCSTDDYCSTSNHQCQALALEGGACDLAGMNAPPCQLALNCVDGLCVRPEQPAPFIADYCHGA